MTFRLTALGLLVASLALAPIGASASPASPADTASPAGTARSGSADPMFGAPTVGLCYDLSAAEVAGSSYPEPPVDCAAPHTAITVAVATLPEGVSYDSDRRVRITLEACFPAMREALGTNMLGLRLTAANAAYFTPTLDQQLAGARWVRCDLVLGDGRALYPLPTKLKIGKYPFADEVSRCLDDQALLTLCSRRHAYRASTAIKIKGKKYPSATAWRRIGSDRCRTAVTSREYRFAWPLKNDWKSGDRVLVCFSKTRR